MMFLCAGGLPSRSLGPWAFGPQCPEGPKVPGPLGPWVLVPLGLKALGRPMGPMLFALTMTFTPPAFTPPGVTPSDQQIRNT
jgi:hypothetical protein